MAEEKHQSSHDSNTVEETTTAKHNLATVDNNHGINKDVSATNWRGWMGRRWLILLVIAVLLFLLALAAATGYMIRNRYERDLNNQPYYTVNRMMHYDGYGSGIGYGQYIQTQVSSGSVTTTVYNYQTGVVTAVNNDSIVIAGNGRQTTIKTNSSTQYVNDKKPAVNDTVSVVGTTTDNTITATQINVIN